jgi:hypothetical protein
MWNEIAAAQEVLYLLVSEPLMNLDVKTGSSRLVECDVSKILLLQGIHRHTLFYSDAKNRDTEVN